MTDKAGAGMDFRIGDVVEVGAWPGLVAEVLLTPNGQLCTANLNGNNVGLGMLLTQHSVALYKIKHWAYCIDEAALLAKGE